MQAGGAAQHLLAQLGRDLDADAAYVGGLGQAIEAAGDLVGQVGAGQLGHPGDLAQVRDRHDAREDRDVTAERPHPLDQLGVVGGPEEQLGDREVRAGLGLRDQHPRIGVLGGRSAGGPPGTRPRRC